MPKYDSNSLASSLHRVRRAAGVESDARSRKIGSGTNDAVIGVKTT